VNVWPIAANWQIQRSSSQLGLRVGSHPALTDFHSDDPSEQAQWYCQGGCSINIVVVLLFLCGWLIVL